MDVQKQIAYWKNGAEEDFAAAEVLLENGNICVNGAKVSL